MDIFNREYPVASVMVTEIYNNPTNEKISLIKNVV